MLKELSSKEMRQWSIAGQKDDDAVYDPELKDGEDSELPWVTKVTDPIKIFAGSEDERHSCRLLLGKARVTLSSKIEERLRQSSPRIEMTGLVMLARATTSA